MSTQDENWKRQQEAKHAETMRRHDENMMRQNAARHTETMRRISGRDVVADSSTHANISFAPFYILGLITSLLYVYYSDWAHSNNFKFGNAINSNVRILFIHTITGAIIGFFYKIIWVLKYLLIVLFVILIAAAYYSNRVN